MDWYFQGKKVYTFEGTITQVPTQSSAWIEEASLDRNFSQYRGIHYNS